MNLSVRALGARRQPCPKGLRRGAACGVALARAWTPHHLRSRALHLARRRSQRCPRGLRHGLALLALTLVPLPAFAGPAATEPTSAGARVDFCSALEAIRPGDLIPGIFAGIYTLGDEHQVFYDPERPLCNGGVQPSTWVEFAPQVEARSELDQILKSRRAFVVLRGELFGPERLGPDDPALAVNLAYANRVAGRRYGHLSAFRTKLVVSAVLEVKPVPESTPWESVWHRPTSAAQLLAVEQAELPQYPPRARQVGLEGDVLVEVTIEGGRVAKTAIAAGDRLLAEAAVANIKTWRFASELKARFSTTFSYKLMSPPSESSESRVIAELPRQVTVIASPNNW